MTKSRTPLPERTPAGEFEEARLRFVLGYPLAQAAIVTHQNPGSGVGGPLQLCPVEYPGVR